jgi:quercetin dioxygenase-like cupin family protein
MEIRRFGIGYRRAEGPGGSRGAQASPIHADRRGIVAELALRPNASVALHSNANLTYLVVIEGGGFVQVGDERSRVAAGEAVVWPPNVDHAVWTELTPLRAIVVEFALEPEDATLQVVVEEAARPNRPPGRSGEPDASPDHGASSLAGHGELAPPSPIEPELHESTEKEPW